MNIKVSFFLCWGWNPAKKAIDRNSIDGAYGCAALANVNSWVSGSMILIANKDDKNKEAFFDAFLLYKEQVKNNIPDK